MITFPRAYERIHCVVTPRRPEDVQHVVDNRNTALLNWMGECITVYNREYGRVANPHYPVYSFTTSCREVLCRGVIDSMSFLQKFISADRLYYTIGLRAWSPTPKNLTWLERLGQQLFLYGNVPGLRSMRLIDNNRLFVFPFFNIYAASCLVLLIDKDLGRSEASLVDVIPEFLESDIRCFAQMRDEQLFTAFFMWLLQHREIHSHSCPPPFVHNDGPGTYIKSNFAQYAKHYLRFRDQYKSLVTAYEEIIASGSNCYRVATDLMLDFIYPLLDAKGIEHKANKSVVRELVDLWEDGDFEEENDEDDYFEDDEDPYLDEDDDD